jgi:hypothetical protein
MRQATMNTAPGQQKAREPDSVRTVIAAMLSVLTIFVMPVP